MGVILGGMASCALAYLLIEQHLRPLYARALGDSAPPRCRWRSLMKYFSYEL